MREKSIEEKLVAAVKVQGGVCWKFTSPGTAGVPDRIVLMPSAESVSWRSKHPAKSPGRCSDFVSKHFGGWASRRLCWTAPIRLEGSLMKYKPHDYQKFAVDFIETHPEAAVLLECGLGKTSITLTALNDLMFDKFEVRKVLIIAPIRVCKNS